MAIKVTSPKPIASFPKANFPTSRIDQIIDIPKVIPNTAVKNEIRFGSDVTLQKINTAGTQIIAIPAKIGVPKYILLGVILIVPEVLRGRCRMLAIMMGKKLVTPFRKVQVFGINAKHQNQIQAIAATSP